MAERKRGNQKSSDILLKILSAITAVILWFVITSFDSSEGTRIFRSVPIKLENISVMESYNLSIISNISSSNYTFDITLSGKRSDLNNLKITDIEAYVDLSEVTAAGRKTFPIQIKNIEKFTITDQDQTSISLYIDGKISLPIPVRAEIKQYITESGTIIQTPICDPVEVMVTGPERILESIAYAQVDLYLGSNKIEKPLDVIENFRLVDSNGDEVVSPYIKTNVTEIEVRVPVVSSKDITLKVNYKNGYYNEKNTEVTITPKTIMVEASPDFLSMFNEISIGTIDEKKIENDQEIIFPIQLPDGVANKSGVSAATVEIKFINTDIKTIVLDKDDFTVSSNDGQNYRILDDSIRIKARGLTANINYLTKSKINAALDISKITEKGTFSVPLDVNVIDDASVFCIGEYYVNVEIS